MHKITYRLFGLFLICNFTLSAQSPETWLPTAGSHGEIHHPVTFAIGDFGYSLTGTNNFNSNTDDVKRYNPVTDTWANLSDFPGGARGFSIGLAYNGSGYVGFGVNGSNYFRDLWRLDTATMQWTQLANCPCKARRHPAMMAAHGKIYVGLGNDNTGDLKDFHVYDIASNTWSALPDIPGSTRHHPFMFTAGGEVYAGMGHGGQIIYDDWYRYDTATNTWQTMTDFPGEARVAGTQFSHRGAGYVLSGDGDNHNFMNTGEFWRYNDQSDTWTQLSPHPGVSRWAPGSFVIGDTLYFFGGVNRQAQSFPTDMHKFWFNSDGVSLTENPITAFNWHPNPSDGVIFVDNPEVDAVILRDLQGRILESQKVDSGRIEFSREHQGVYLIEIIMDSGERRFDRIVLQ